MNPFPTRFIDFLSRGLLLLLSLASGGVSTARASTGDGQPMDTNIVYVGRWDRTVANLAKSNWSGAYFRVNFTGPTVQLQLAQGVAFYVSIDGGAWAAYSPTSGGSVNLTPTPLAAGTHTLRVAARSEKDSVQFKGLVLASGAATQPPEGRAYRIEFIGDSITAGYALDQWALQDFAWRVGEVLNAGHTQIAYSGICLQNGVRCPWGGSVGMSQQYFKMQTVDAPSPTAWDFSRFVPDAVVINLGTNDSNSGVADDTFQNTYVTFLQDVRSRYPNASLFVLRTFGGYKAAPTVAAVNQRVAAGDTKLFYVDTTGWVTPNSSDFVPDGVHPSASGHVKIANQLAPILSRRARWESPRADDFNDGNADGWGAYGGSWSVTNGRLGVAYDRGAKAVIYGSLFSNFTYDADVAVGASGNAGLLLRASQMAVGVDGYQGYYAGISASSVVLGRAEGATWTELGNATLSTSTVSRHVRVVAAGPSLTVYVDDMTTPKLSVTDATHVDGAVGVRTFETAATFDNVSVLAPTRLESSLPGSFVRHQLGRGRIDNALLPAEDAQFRPVPGLADSSAVSFESINFPGFYLRHRNGEVWLDSLAQDSSPAQFKMDATWRRRAGLADSTRSSFETSNFAGSYLRHRNGLLYAEPLSTALDRSDATFREE